MEKFAGPSRQRFRRRADGKSACNSLSAAKWQNAYGIVVRVLRWKETGGSACGEPRSGGPVCLRSATRVRFGDSTFSISKLLQPLVTGTGRRSCVRGKSDRAWAERLIRVGQVRDQTKCWELRSVCDHATTHLPVASRPPPLGAEISCAGAAGGIDARNRRERHALHALRNYRLFALGTWRSSGGGCSSHSFRRFSILYPTIFSNSGKI